MLDCQKPDSEFTQVALALTSTNPVDVGRLEAALKAAERKALLLPSRLLGRIIKSHRGLGVAGWRIPHGKSYVIDRDALLQIVDPNELGLTAATDLPRMLMLLVRPDPQQLAGLAGGKVLVEYWRLLFHARIHLALERRFSGQPRDDPAMRARLQSLGWAEFAEIGDVLRQDNFLLPPWDRQETYMEFAAVYLELWHFGRHLLPCYFPTLVPDAGQLSRTLGTDRVGLILVEDLGKNFLPELYRDLWSFAKELLPHQLPAALPSSGRLAGVFEDERMVQLFAQERLLAPPESSSTFYSMFAGRGLKDAGQVLLPAGTAANQETADRSPQASPGLPGPASPEALRRLLGRAEKAEAVGNVVRGAILRRQAAREAATDAAAPVVADAHVRLESLAARLQQALGFEAVEVRPWRQCLAALLEKSTEGTWPQAGRLLYDLQKACVDTEHSIYAVDLVEWCVSLGERPIKRLLEHQGELLQIKHLRQAAQRLSRAGLDEEARRQLADLLRASQDRCENKLRAHFRPRIRAALEKVGIQPRDYPEQVAQAKLTEELLDRICERGFVAMSDLRDALARNQLKLPDLSGPREFVRGDPLIRANRRFATTLDGVYRRGEIYLRWLQRLSAAAFGTSVGRFLTRYVALPFGGAYVVLEGAQHLVGLLTEDIHLMSWTSVALLGAFLLALMHVPLVRQGLAQGLTRVGRAARLLLIECPAFLLRLPLMRRLLSSWPLRMFRRLVLKPLAWTAVAFLVFRGCGFHWQASIAGSIVFFLTINLFFNSRPGRELEEVLSDWLNYHWCYLRTDLVPGLFRFVIFVFKQLLDEIERWLYSVDEWLRFKSGDSRLSLLMKPVLGLLWFLFTYLIRIYINLLIEPTVNPIKHFPVVTVAAKIMLPFIPLLTRLLAAPLLPLGPVVANSFAVMTLFFLPGIFGFLVWELKENWRLYAANRSPVLQAEIVGQHGETMLRFMKPGLHSGRLPKLYGKLRRAEHRARITGSWKTYRKHQEALHHVGRDVKRFVERQWVALLAGCQCWASAPLCEARTGLGYHQIRVTLAGPGRGVDNLEIVFTEQMGQLVARIARPGWLCQLSAEQRRTLRIALAGLYKRAGVDLVHEQIEFQMVAITWRDWVNAWEREQAGQGEGKPFLEGIRLLPPLQPCLNKEDR